MAGLGRRICVGLAACGLAVLLGACAGGTSGQAELATASDQTAAQKRAQIRMQLAIGYYEQGQLAVALDEIKLALLADPGYADGYGVRALIYMGMEEFALAEDNFLRALKLAPGNPDLSNNYGSFLCQNGRARESIAYFETALKSRTYQWKAKALNNAGSCSLKMKDNVGAERYLLQALKLDPDIAATNANLARIYYERREYVRAGFYIARLGKTAKPESLTADVLWLSAKVQYRLGDTGAVDSVGTQLRRHHASSPEYASFQRGAFDE